MTIVIQKLFWKFYLVNGKVQFARNRKAVLKRKHYKLFEDIVEIV